MTRLALVALVAGSLALGGGSGYWFFVRPAQEEQLKLQGTVAARQAEKAEIEAKIRRLEEARSSQGMARVAYFDLRRAANPTREMEAKTVETLAGLTTIFQDQHLEIQTLVPEGVTQGLERPVPTAAPSVAPGESPAPAPTPDPAAASPTPAPVRLTHKVYRVVLRGEYGDLVKALREIQALPRAININQFAVKLVRLPEDKADGEAALESPSRLELSFHFSVSFVIGEVAGAPQGLAGRALALACSGLAWAWSFVEQPAVAAELIPRMAQLAPTDEGTKHTGADLVRSGGTAKPKPQRAKRRAAAARVRPRRHHRVRPRAQVAHRPIAIPGPSPTPTIPTATPTPMAVPTEPTLQRPYTGTYAFPIVRAGEAGRQNPFRPVGLALKAEPTLGGAALGGSALPPVVPAPPALPSGERGVAPPPAGGAPTLPAPRAAAGGIQLLGILAGGGGAPMALLQVGGVTRTVGINEVIPGKARVTAIRADRVSLTVDGRELTLTLTR